MAIGVMTGREPEANHTRQRTCDATEYLARLRLHGFRVTPTVSRVVEVLHASARPLSYADLTRALSVRSRKGLDRVTLYRILSRLTASGVVFRWQTLDGPWHFALVGQSVFGYFECAQCRRVHGLTIDPALPAFLNQLNKILDRQGIGTADVPLIVQGTCGPCNRKGC